MKEKLIIVLLNLIVLLCAYIFSLIPEPHKSVIINIFVGIGIFVFLIWSFGHGNVKLYHSFTTDVDYSTSKGIWNLFKVLVGGMVVWNILFKLW